MSEPIMELVDAYGSVVWKYGPKLAVGARAAIEREVAALRERAERAEIERDDAVHATKMRTHCLMEARQRIAALEAERAALFDAGGALARCVNYYDDGTDVSLAIEIFNDQPGALAAWMAKTEIRQNTPSAEGVQYGSLAGGSLPNIPADSEERDIASEEHFATGPLPFERVPTSATDNGVVLKLVEDDQA